MNYLLLSFILQTDKFRTFLCWQSKVKASFAEQISPGSGFHRVGVHPLHWQAHVRRPHKVCHLIRGQGVAQAQACSWLHPSLHLSHLLLDFALQKILLSLLYWTALNGISSSAWKHAVISCLKPLLSLHLLSLLSSLSYPLLQEKESALWPFCHLCALLICCNLMLVPAVLLVPLSTSGYSCLIAKCFSVFSVVGLKTH